MWQEARKNEKKIRSLMVDHKKRVERKKDFYERIRRDPVEFLQVHASAIRIHIDSAISAAAENCLMPWHGDKSNMIDRFDARAHLEDVTSAAGETFPAGSSSTGKSGPSSESSSRMESRINFERWKNLIHYEFSGVPENKVLHQIFQEERDVTALVHPQSKYQQQQSQAIKKKVEAKKAAIGYNYDSRAPVSKAEESSSSEESDVEPVKDPPSFDMHSCPPDQVLRINSIAQKYFVNGDDFVRFMDEDRNEAERIQLAKDIETEKSMFAGRKSRRERKALKERRMLIVRSTTAAQECEKAATPGNESDSSSSESDHKTKRSSITEFITSFGASSSDESEKERAIKHAVGNKTTVPNNRSKNLQDFRVKHDDRNGRDRERRESFARGNSNHGSKYRHRSRSESRERSSRRNKRSRSRSRETRRHRNRRDKSRSKSRSKSRDRRRRSRSRSVDAFGRIRRARTSPSPTPAAVAFPSLPVQTCPLPVAQAEASFPEQELKQEPPPPPLKRYYRHDLESEASASDSEKDEKSKGCDQQEAGEKERAVSTVPSDNKVRPAGSDSGKSSKIHKILMKKTRAQIESHYRKDKDRRMREEKMRSEERREPEDRRRERHSSSRSSHRRRRSSSSS